MTSLGRVILITVLSLVLHIGLGWMWTSAAGVAGGLWSRRLGWLIGLTGVTLGWGLVVAYSFYEAPYPTSEMARIFGSIAGNLPSAFTVAGTILIGAAIGGLGGMTGQMFVRSMRDRNG